MAVGRPSLEHLDTLRGSKTVILGVGNILRGDDGVGPLVCERLSGKVSTEVIDAGTVPENHIRRIVDARPDHLLVIDAVGFGDTPGTIRIFGPDQIAAFAFSTHALSPRLFIDMLRREIKVTVHLIGVQPSHTALGEPVSSAVQEAIETLVDLLVRIFPRVP